MCRNHVSMRAIAKGALVQSLPWRTVLAGRAAPCSKQHSGLTLDISEAGHARATCLLTVVPSPRQVNFNWGTNLSHFVFVACAHGSLRNTLIFEEMTNCIAMSCYCRISEPDINSHRKESFLVKYLKIYVVHKVTQNYTST